MAKEKKSTVTRVYVQEDQHAEIRVVVEFEHVESTSQDVSRVDVGDQTMTMVQGAARRSKRNKGVVIEATIKTRGGEEQRLVLSERDFNALADAVSKVVPPRSQLGVLGPSPMDAYFDDGEG